MAKTDSVKLTPKKTDAKNRKDSKPTKKVVKTIRNEKMVKIKSKAGKSESKKERKPLKKDGKVTKAMKIIAKNVARITKKREVIQKPKKPKEKPKKLAETKEKKIAKPRKKSQKLATTTDDSNSMTSEQDPLAITANDLAQMNMQNDSTEKPAKKPTKKKVDTKKIASKLIKNIRPVFVKKKSQSPKKLFANVIPKRRMASLNALAKVQCLYENESRGALLTFLRRPCVDKPVESASTRTLRTAPGIRGAGKHWDMHIFSSSEESSNERDKQALAKPKKYTKIVKTPIKSDVKKKKNRTEIVMDLKDMVVKKRMASLNATAILAASYSPEAKKSKVEEVVKKEADTKIIELRTTPSKKKVSVIVNQDTDVTITGVYVNSTTRSTHREEFCSISGMQYHISATSHTQTNATAVATETIIPQEPAPELKPPKQPAKSYTPINALSNMKPPGSAATSPQRSRPMKPTNPSAFTAPHAYDAGQYETYGPRTFSPHLQTHHHHLPTKVEHHAPSTQAYAHGYYQPTGPLINPHHHGSIAPPASLPAHIGPIGPPAPIGKISTPLTSLDSSSTSSCTPPFKHAPHSSTSVTSETSADGSVTPLCPTDASSHSIQQPVFRYPPTFPTGAPSYTTGYGFPGQYYLQPAPPPPPHDTSSYYHPPSSCFSTTPTYPGSPSHATYYHKTYLPTGGYRRYITAPQHFYPATTDIYRYYSSPSSSATSQSSHQLQSSTSISGGEGGAPTNSGPPNHAPAYHHPNNTHIVETYQPNGPPQTGPISVVETYSTAPPPHYYPSYGAPPGCYTHAPPSRNLAFIDTAYHTTCPCPLQSCPKNVHTGPLTGDGKRSNMTKDQPLPPVALALPLEASNAAGPPSPARGSAGMPPPPSPAGATYQPISTPKQETDEVRLTSPGDVDKAPIMRKARVGKTMVRNTIFNSVSNLVNERFRTKPSDTNGNASDRNNNVGGSPDNVRIKLEPNVSPALEVNRDVSVAVIVDNPVVEKPDEKTVASNCPDATQTTKHPETVAAIDYSTKLGVDDSTEPLNSINAPTQLSKTNKIKLKSDARPNKTGSYKDLIRRTNFLNDCENGVKRKCSNDEKGGKKLRVDACEAAESPLEMTDVKTVDITDETDKSDKTATATNKPGLINGKTSDCATSNQTVTNLKLVRRKSKSSRAEANVIAGLPDKNDNNNECLNSNGANDDSALDVTIETVVKRADDAEKRDKTEMKHFRIIRGDTNERKDRARTKVEVKEVKLKQIKAAVKSTKKDCKYIIKEQVLESCGGKNRKSKSKVLRRYMVEYPNITDDVPRNRVKPKWSNGWSWEGPSFIKDVFLNNDDILVRRKCYNAMRHDEGDVICVRDCVLLKSGPRKNDLPYVAKISDLWENPEDGEMMMSLYWFYRPEHTEQGRQPSDHPDEVFASRHKDHNSVACIEDKCYVLTYFEYCRYRKHIRRIEQQIDDVCPTVPDCDSKYPRLRYQPPRDKPLAPEMVLFCQRVYDFRQKRIVKNPS